MITKWKLFNFKSIQEETELTLRPLTILAGSNSSGKSTVLQSMLLISQTLASKVRSRSVILNGPLIKLGQFDDLRSYGSEANQILIGWECQPQATSTTMSNQVHPANVERRLYYGLEDELTTIMCEVSFQVDPHDSQRDLQQLQPQLFGCTLNVDLKAARMISPAMASVRRSQRTPQAKVSEYKIRQIPAEMEQSLAYDVQVWSQLNRDFSSPDHDFSSVELIGCDVNHFLPNHLVVCYDSVKENANNIISALTLAAIQGVRSRQYHNLVIPDKVVESIRRHLEPSLAEQLLSEKEHQPTGFGDNEITIEKLNHNLHHLDTQTRQLLRSTLVSKGDSLAQDIRQAMAEELGQHYELGQRPLTDEISAGVNYLNRFFATQVKYLGPLRDEPKALYPLAANADPMDIGYRGEHTAAVLDLHKDQFILYIPSRVFNQPDIELGSSRPENKATTRTLETAVFDWLNYMGVAERLVTRDRGKLGHELKVTTAGTSTPHDLTHVGVGVSQVLPILVMCLLAESDTTIIIEQPELHLHPKVQTLLGDFFLSMSLLGKQIIVETHSEYIINRLRFRTAAAQDDRIAKQIKIYFAEKQGGASFFQDVDVNEYGAIANWPEGFFDQSQSEAEEILRAATRKRKLAREEERNAKRNH